MIENRGADFHRYIAHGSALALRAVVLSLSSFVALGHFFGVNACIEKADTINQYLDDSVTTVRITRVPDRIDTMDGGYGTEDKDLRTIIVKYVYEFGKMDDD